jgi:hypothetical protein
MKFEKLYSDKATLVSAIGDLDYADFDNDVLFDAALRNYVVVLPHNLMYRSQLDNTYKLVCVAGLVISYE